MQATTDEKPSAEANDLVLATIARARSHMREGRISHTDDRGGTGLIWRRRMM